MTKPMQLTLLLAFMCACAWGESNVTTNLVVTGEGLSPDINGLVMTQRDNYGTNTAWEGISDGTNYYNYVYMVAEEFPFRTMSTNLGMNIGVSQWEAIEGGVDPEGEYNGFHPYVGTATVAYAYVTNYPTIYVRGSSISSVRGIRGRVQE